MTSVLKALALPELAGDKSLQFTTLESCKAWIKAQPIANAPQAQLRLRYQLESFNRYALPDDPSAALRLEMLEQLRVPVSFVQAECAKRYVKQHVPLPLPDSEQVAFNSGRALWLALGTGYLQVLRLLFERAECAHGTSLNETERNTAARAARCAMTSARSDYLLHLHAGLLPDARFWHRLHLTLRLAEALDVSHCVVGDKPAAAAVYVEILLLGMAPLCRLSSKQKEQVAYWAQRWSPRVPLLPKPPEDTRTPSIVTDVSGDRPPAYAAAGTPAVSGSDSTGRWLDLRDLRKTLKQRLLKLAEGATPQELHLGGICSQTECGELLEQVYRDWCKGGRSSNRVAPGKAFERCEWVTGIEAIYHQLGGPHIQSSRKESSSPYQFRRSHEEIAVLGDVIRHGIGAEEAAAAAEEPTHVVEHGQVLDENLHEIFLQCSLDAQTTPLRAEQLVLVRLGYHQASTEDRCAWQLAQIRWVAHDLGTAHRRIGVHLFPGVPRAAQLFVPAHAEAKAQTMHGLCLPEVPSLDQPATVLLPPGGFGVDRMMEIRNPERGGSSVRIRLIRRLELGADFERCTYEEMT